MENMSRESGMPANVGSFIDGFKGWRLINKLWLLFSVPFICYILWQYLQTTQFNRGIQLGTERASAVIYNDIIDKAANDACNSIFIERDGRRVDLINVQCLNISSTPPTEEGSAATENTKN